MIAEHGKQLAVAIGVLGPYESDEDRDDVEGSDLCHIRRVRWLSKSEHRFKWVAVSQGRFSGCNDRDVLAWVARAVVDADLLRQIVASFELTAVSLARDSSDSMASRRLFGQAAAELAPSHP